MRWIEIIHLRMKSNSDSESKKNQQRLIQKSIQSETSQTVRIYHRPEIEGDLCILLEWKSENAAGLKSVLGMHLTASLKEFGRVDHAVWAQI